MKNRIWLIAALLFFYLVFYVVLSTQGRYAPSSIGAGHVKSYAWAPKGFTSGPYDVKWHSLPMRVFFPLYLLDTRCWHTRYRIYDRIYPINETLHNELQKACQKWNKEMDAEWEKKKELLQPPQPTPTAENAGKRD